MANLTTMTNWMSVILSSQLDQTQIQTLLNKADLEECENWTWARLRSRTAINSFAAITFPSITAVQGSAIVTSNGAPFPPVTTQFAFRVSGQFYVPIGVVANSSSSTTLTLATPYPAVGGSNLSGTLFQLYYSIPGWQEVTSVTQQIPLKRMAQEELDIVDPWLSQIASPALRWIPQGRDASDNVQVTLWPIETNANGYIMWGLRGHVDMVNPTDLPAIPSSVITAKALSEACESLYTLKGDGQWQDMRDYYRQIYQDERERVQEQDRQQYGVISRVQDSSRRNAVGLDVVPFRDGLEWE